VNSPPNPDFRVNPDPPEGLSPLEVTFNMCRSTDPDPGDVLKFTFDFGDGTDFRGNCRTTHTYLNPGGPPNPRANLCVTDGRPGHERCQGFAIIPRSRTPPNPCANDREPPTGTFSIDSAKFPELTLSVDDADDDVGVEAVLFSERFGEGDFEPIQSVSTPPYRTTWSPDPDDDTCRYTLLAEIKDVCGKVTQLPTRDVDFCVDFARAAVATVALTSDLKLGGGQGRVTVNGGGSLTVGSFPLRASLPVQAGDNLVEALVVGGKGQAGTWRFEVAGGLLPGSLRVDAGEVVLVAGDAVVFRLTGRPGERLAFRFRAQPR
jgi:hypothetical protein